jgi:hypothetical protein
MLNDPHMGIVELVGEPYQRQTFVKILVCRLGFGSHAGEELHSELHGPSQIGLADICSGAKMRRSSPRRIGVAYKTYYHHHLT